MKPTIYTYNAFVAALVKPGEALINTLTPQKADLQHMGIGVAGEAGELLDAIKKHTIYGKELDRKNVIEELGDLEFYLQGIRNNLGITREEVLQGNIDKLSERYAKLTYSDAAAIERKDKEVAVENKQVVPAMTEDLPNEVGSSYVDCDSCRGSGLSCPRCQGKGKLTIAEVAEENRVAAGDKQSDIPVNTTPFDFTCCIGNCSTPVSTEFSYCDTHRYLVTK